jgi:hypothetical protein
LEKQMVRRTNRLSRDRKLGVIALFPATEQAMGNGIAM